MRPIPKLIPEPGNFIKSLGAPIFIGAFFCFLVLYYGVGVYPDTESYVHLTIYREPLYQIYIWICQQIGGDQYQIIAVIGQNILAVFANCMLYRYFTNKFQLNTLFSLGIMACLLAPHLLISIFSSSGMILGNAILTEGIAYSLYLLFFLYMVKFLGEERAKIRYALTALFIGILIVLTRTQLLSVLLMWTVIVSGFYLIKKKWLYVIAPFFIVCLAFLFRSGFISVYENVVGNGSDVGTGSTTLATSFLYATDENTADQIKDPEVKALFLVLREQIEQGELSYEYAGDGIINKVYHHENSFDVIGFDVLNNKLEEQAQKITEIDGRDTIVVMNEMAMKLTKELFPIVAGNWLKIYVLVALGGMIRSISVLNSIFIWQAVLMYAGSILLFVLLYKRKNKKENSVLFLLPAIYIMILGNVMSTSITIMCLSRYMIYNMPLFYIVIIVMMWELWRTRNVTLKKENKNGI